MAGVGRKRRVTAYFSSTSKSQELPPSSTWIPSLRSTPFTEDGARREGDCGVPGCRKPLFPKPPPSPQPLLPPPLPQADEPRLLLSHAHRACAVPSSSPCPGCLVSAGLWLCECCAECPGQPVRGGERAGGEAFAVEGVLSLSSPSSRRELRARDRGVVTGRDCWRWGC